MCGISGLFPFSNCKFTVDELKEEMKVLLAMNQARGEDATGIYVSGSNQLIAKTNMPADQFIYTKEFDKPWKQDRIWGAIGHTRKSTQGSPDLNCNNHPLLVDNFVFIHNGSCRNNIPTSESVFGTVDSLWFPWKFNQTLDKPFYDFNEEASDETLSVIKQNLLAVQGTFAVCWQDVRYPHLWYLVRDDNQGRDVYTTVNYDLGYFKFTQIEEDQSVLLNPYTLLQIDVLSNRVETFRINKGLSPKLLDFIKGIVIPKNLTNPTKIKRFIARQLENEYKGEEHGQTTGNTYFYGTSYGGRGNWDS